MYKLPIQFILLLSSMFLVQAQHLRLNQDQDERRDQLRLACTASPMTKCDLAKAPGKGVYVCRSYGTYNVGTIKTTLCVPPLLILPKDECTCCGGQCPKLCDCECGKWTDGGQLVDYTLPNGVDVKQCYPTHIASFVTSAFFPTFTNPYSCVPKSDPKCDNPFFIDGEEMEEPAGGWDPVPDINEMFPIAGYDENGNPIISEDAPLYYPEFDPDLNAPPVDPVAGALPIVPVEDAAPVEVAPIQEEAPIEVAPVQEETPVEAAPVQELPAVMVDVPYGEVPVPDKEAPVEGFGFGKKFFNRDRDNGGV